MTPLIITLDGPAGTGKSTVARQLAGRLGLEFLDTGAMYRGLTAACLDAGLDPADQPEACAELARRVSLRFDWAADPPRLYLCPYQGGARENRRERDLTDRLREPDVTARVSELAAIGPVREVLVEAQRQIGREHPRLVTEGRDQGSVVFPQAQVKFYLDAAAAVRARRRAEQLRAMGQPADEATIRQEIISRDARDSKRRQGPLTCPPDAICVDTTHLSLPGVLDQLERLVRQRVDVTADLRSG